MAEEYHLEKFPPIRPRPETTSTAITAAGLSVSSSTSLNIATTSAPGNTSVSCVFSSASSIATVTRGSAALPLSMAYSQVPVMVVNPMQQKKSSVASVTLSTQSIQTCSPSNTTVTSSTSSATNKTELIQLQNSVQNSGLMFGNPFAANSFSTNIMSGNLLQNPVIQTNQVPGNIVLTPFVQNGVLQGNVFQGSFPQGSGLQAGIVQIGPQQFGLVNIPQLSMTLPPQNLQVPISSNHNSSGNSRKEAPVVEKKSVKKVATASSSYQFVIEPDPAFDDKLKGAKLEKIDQVTDKSIPSTKDRSLPNKQSRQSSTESVGYTEMPRQEFCPKIEYCYSMKKLSLRQMMELLDKGQNVMLFVKPETKDYYRAKVLCEAVVKHNVTGINADINSEFYTSLISPYISLAEAMLLKKDIRRTLNLNEKNEDTISSIFEEADKDNVSGQNSVAGNESEILKWKTEKLEVIDPKLYQKYCSTTKDDSERKANEKDEGLIREEIEQEELVDFESKSTDDLSRKGTKDRLKKHVGNKKEVENDNEASKSHLDPIQETQSKQSKDSQTNLNVLVNKGHTIMEKRSNLVKEGTRRTTSDNILSKGIEIEVGQKKRAENVIIPNVDNKVTREIQQIESDTELLRKEYMKEEIKQKGGGNEAELIRDMYKVQAKNKKQTNQDCFVKDPLQKSELKEPADEAELIRRAFTLSRSKAIGSDSTCSGPKENQSQTETNKQVTTANDVSEDVIEIHEDTDDTDDQDLEIRLPDMFHQSKWRWTTLARTQHFTDEEADKILKHCYLCGLEFQDASQTWKHIISEHAKINAESLFSSNYFCSHCYETSSSMKLARQHELDVHLSDFPCYFCGLSIDDRWDMLSHIAGVHSLLYTCTICQGQFLGKHELLKHCKTERHMQKNEIDDCQLVTFMCLFCNVKFNAKQNLISHLNGTHIDTAIPNTSESVCSACRHSFLDAQALFSHRNPDARQPMKDRPLSIASLSALAVQGIHHKDKVDALKEKKKRMGINRNTTQSTKFSKVQDYLTTSDVDKFGYRDLTIGEKKYKYPIKELFEHCEFGRNFPNKFVTLAMDELIKLMIHDFQTLQVNRTSSDLQDLLVALSRSQKFSRILQKYGLKPLPWNGKIQACVKMFLNKVKAGCYRNQDSVSMAILGMSVQKSLNYLEDKRNSVKQKLRAKIIRNAEDSEISNAGVDQKTSSSDKNVCPNAESSQSKAGSSSTTSVDAKDDQSDNSNTHSAHSHSRKRSRTPPKCRPIAQASERQSRSMTAARLNVQNKIVIPPAVNLDDNTIGSLSSVDTSKPRNVFPYDFSLTDRKAKLLRRIKRKMLKQRPIAPKGGLNVFEKDAVESEKPTEVPDSDDTSANCSTYVSASKKRCVRISRKAVTSTKLRKLAHKKSHAQLVRQHTIKTVREMISKRRDEALTKGTRKDILQKEKQKVQCEGNVIVKKRPGKISGRKNDDKNACSKNLRKRNSTVRYTFDNILDESEEESSPSPVEMSESEDEWKPPKLESDTASSVDESSDADDSDEDEFSDDQSIDVDDFENDTVSDDIKSTEIENGSEQGILNVNNAGSEKHKPIIILNKSISKGQDLIEASANETCLLDKPFISESLSENNVKENVANSDRVKAEEQGKFSDIKYKDSLCDVNSTLHNVQKRNVSQLDKESLPSKVIKIENSADSLGSCSRKKPWLDDFVKCCFVKIDRSDIADSLGLELVVACKDYTDRKLTRTFVKQICKERSDVNTNVVHASDTDLSFKKEQKNEKGFENESGYIKTMEQVSPPKIGRERRKILQENLEKSMGLVREDALPRKRGRPKKTTDQTKPNSDDLIILNDGDTPEEKRPRKDGRPRKILDYSVPGSECLTIHDEVCEVEGANTDKEDNEIEKSTKGNLENRIVSCVESNADKITRRKAGRPRKEEAMMREKQLVSESDHNIDIKNFKLSTLKEMGKGVCYEEMKEIDEEAGNSELFTRKMLRPRKKCNYFEEDCSDDSSSDSEDIEEIEMHVEFKDEGIQNLSRLETMDMFCGESDSNAVPKPNLINVTRSEDVDISVDSIDNTDEAHKSDFVDTETKRMLSKFRNKASEEEHAHSEIETKATNDELKATTKRKEIEKEVSGEVIKSAFRIKEEKEDPEYSKALASIYQTGSVSTEGSQPLQIANPTGQMSSQFANLAKGNQTGNPSSVSSQLPTISQIWSLSFNESQALVTSATSNSETCTSASTAASLITANPVVKGKEQIAQNALNSNKMEVPPSLAKIPPNAQVIRHPVLFYPGNNSVTQSPSEAGLLQGSLRNCSSSSLKLVPVSGSNRFILVDVATQQSVEIPPQGQAQDIHVDKQKKKGVELTQGAQEAQTLQKPQAIPKPQATQPKQAIKQQQITQNKPQSRQLPNILTKTGGKGKISTLQQSNQLKTSETSDLEGLTQLGFVTIKQEVITDEEFSSEVEKTGLINKSYVSDIQTSLPVTPTHSAVIQNPPVQAGLPVNSNQSAIIQQGSVPVVQHQNLLSNQLQFLQPGHLQVPGMQSISGFIPNQFQVLNQSGQLLQGLQYCQPGVQQLGPLQIGNVAQNQTHQTVPILGSEGSTQTLMVNQQTPLAPGQLIYVPSSSQTGSSGQTAPILNSGQIGNSSSLCPTGQIRNNSGKMCTTPSGNHTAQSGTALNTDQGSVVIPSGPILSATGNNPVQTGQDLNHAQTGQVLNPAQTGLGFTTAQTGQVLNSAQTGQILNLPQTGQLFNSAQTGQVLNPAQTGQIINLAQTGQLFNSAQTGQVFNPAQTGQVLNSAQTGHVLNPAHTGSVLNSAQIGQVLNPAQTGQILNSAQTGQVLNQGQIGSNVVQGFSAVNPMQGGSMNPVQGGSAIIQTLQGPVFVQTMPMTETTAQNQVPEENVTNAKTYKKLLPSTMKNPTEEHRCGDCNLVFKTQEGLSNHRISELHFLSPEEMKKAVEKAESAHEAISILLPKMFSHKELLFSSVMVVQNPQGANKQPLNPKRRTMIEEVVGELFGATTTEMRNTMHDRIRDYRLRHIMNIEENEDQ